MKLGLFNNKNVDFSTTKKLSCQDKKIVSIVSIVFKTTQESRLGSSTFPPAIPAAKVLKTIETIETILILFQHCLSKNSVCFTTARACARWA